MCSACCASCPSGGEPSPPSSPWASPAGSSSAKSYSSSCAPKYSSSYGSSGGSSSSSLAQSGSSSYQSIGSVSSLGGSSCVLCVSISVGGSWDSDSPPPDPSVDAAGTGSTAAPPASASEGGSGGSGGTSGGGCASTRLRRSGRQLSSSCLSGVRGVDAPVVFGSTGSGASTPSSSLPCVRHGTGPCRNASARCSFSIACAYSCADSALTSAAVRQSRSGLRQLTCSASISLTSSGTLANSASIARSRISSASLKG